MRKAERTETYVQRAKDGAQDWSLAGGCISASALEHASGSDDLDAPLHPETPSQARLVPAAEQAPLMSLRAAHTDTSHITRADASHETRLTEYERQRLGILRRNQERMQALQDAAQEIRRGKADTQRAVCTSWCAQSARCAPACHDICPCMWAVARQCCAPAG